MPGVGNLANRCTLCEGNVRRGSLPFKDSLPFLSYSCPFRHLSKPSQVSGIFMCPGTALFKNGLASRPTHFLIHHFSSACCEGLYNIHEQQNLNIDSIERLVGYSDPRGLLEIGYFCMCCMWSVYMLYICTKVNLRGLKIKQADLQLYNTFKMSM